MCRTNWIKIQHKDKRIRKEIAIPRPKCASLTSLLCSVGIYPIEFHHPANLGHSALFSWIYAIGLKPQQISLKLVYSEIKLGTYHVKDLRIQLLSYRKLCGPSILLRLALPFYQSPGLWLIHDNSLTCIWVKSWDSKMHKAYQMQNVPIVIPIFVESQAGISQVWSWRNPIF